MTEIEKLIDRQIANTKHAVRGGKFDTFNGRRIALPERKPNFAKDWRVTVVKLGE